MSIGRGRERERADTPATSTRPPAGANSGRSVTNLMRPVPTVPRPATPRRHTFFCMTWFLLRRDEVVGALEDFVRIAQEALHVAGGLPDAVFVLNQADADIAF